MDSPKLSKLYGNEKIRPRELAIMNRKMLGINTTMHTYLN